MLTAASSALHRAAASPDHATAVPATLGLCGWVLAEARAYLEARNAEPVGQGEPGGAAVFTVDISAFAARVRHASFLLAQIPQRRVPRATRPSLRWRLGCQDEVWGEAGWLADAEAALAAGDSAVVERLRTRAVSLLQLTPTGGRCVSPFCARMMMRTLEARAAS